MPRRARSPTSLPTCITTSCDGSAPLSQCASVLCMMMYATSAPSNVVWCREPGWIRRVRTTARSGARAPRQERTQPGITQQQSAPDEGTKVDGKQDMREQWIQDPHVRRDRATKVAGEQDRAEDRCTRCCIQQRRQQ